MNANYTNLSQVIFAFFWITLGSVLPATAQSDGLVSHPDSSHLVVLTPTPGWTQMSEFTAQITKYVYVTTQRRGLEVKQYRIGEQVTVAIFGLENESAARIFYETMRADNPPFLQGNQTQHALLLAKPNLGYLIEHHDWKQYLEFHEATYRRPAGK